LIGFEKVMRDATRRKIAEEEMQRSHDELSAFSYMVAHDLRAPLRTVGVNVQRLLTVIGATAQPEAAKLAVRICADLAAMDDLIKDLLRLSEVATETETEPVGVNLETALARAEANLQSSLQQAGGAVTHDTLPVIRGNPAHFIELFQNLIGNALKYRSEGAPPRIHVSGERKGAAWEISVADNGIGIDPKYKDRIFGSFTRLHGQELPGTGLGLAICQRIVTRYGGRIWVESEPGRGSTFRLTLLAN
jgi:signal transduction histidine kinase